MGMPGRKYMAGSSYRYGFNGQERSIEIHNNSFTAEYWEYDSRIGKRWNIDPVPKIMFSPYVVLANSPIMFVDPNGADWYKNKRSGDVEWYEGSGKRKGHKHLGETWNGYATVNGEKHWVNFEANGKKTVWENEVVVKATISKKEQKKRDTEAWRKDLYIAYGRLRDGQPLVQGGESANFISHLDYYKRYYQAEQGYRKMSYGAVVTLTAPVALVYGGFAVPSAVGYVASLELPALYYESSLYAWKTTTHLLNFTKDKILLGTFAAANHYMPYSLKRAIVKQLSAPLPNVVTPQNIETIVEALVPGPTMKK
jgi:hypothetical protein